MASHSLTAGSRLVPSVSPSRPSGCLSLSSHVHSCLESSHVSCSSWYHTWQHVCFVTTPQQSQREPLSPLPHLQRLHGGFFSSKYTICTACGRWLLRQTKRSVPSSCLTCAGVRSAADGHGTGRVLSCSSWPQAASWRHRHEGDASLWPNSLKSNQCTAFYFKLL